MYSDERAKQTLIGEPVYTAVEVAEAKKLHPSTVRKLFIDEPGVIRLGRWGSRRSRSYFTLRIPESVVNRVFARMTVRS